MLPPRLESSTLGGVREGVCIKESNFVAKSHGIRFFFVYLHNIYISKNITSMHPFNKIYENEEFVKVHAYDLSVPMHYNQVIFLEEEYDLNVNQYIQDNLHDIKEMFQLCGMEFFYLPEATLTREQRAYWDPANNPKSETLQLRSSMLYDIIEGRTVQGHLPALLMPCGIEENHHTLLGIEITPDDPAQAFKLMQLFCSRLNKPKFSINCFEEKDEGIMGLEEAPYEQKEKPASASKPAKRRSFLGTWWDESATSHSRVTPHAKEDVQPIEEELPLTDEEQKLMDDIQAKLNVLRSHGLPEVVLERLFAPSVKPSRIEIKKDGTIVLPDYNNTVIDMIPLDKVLYLLLLRHPEGIYQKDLSDHIDEMKELYCRINNGFLPNRALAGILNLASPLSNSCNEKISRIRKVFQSHFQPAIAAFYTITGGRGEAKKVPIDPSLVSFTT